MNFLRLRSLLMTGVVQDIYNFLMKLCDLHQYAK